MSTFVLFQQPGGFTAIFFNIFPLILIFGVFYVLIILPQRRRQRELQQMIDSLKAGDQIVTTGGIVGTITAVRENTLLVRSADKSILEISRAAVAGLHGAVEKKK